MTDDQHRAGQLTAAQILIADALERHAADPRDPHHVAAWILEQLQAAGWTPPRTPGADVPPLRPDTVAAANSPGRQAFRQARADLANRTRR
jgi:hypothetical protein